MARTPIHPGEILKDEIGELNISAAELAREIKVPPNRITQILSGKRAITADTALRFGKWFGPVLNYGSTFNRHMISILQKFKLERR